MSYYQYNHNAAVWLDQPAPLNICGCGWEVTPRNLSWSTAEPNNAYQTADAVPAPTTPTLRDPDVAIQSIRYTTLYTEYVLLERVTLRTYGLLDSCAHWEGVGERSIMNPTSDLSVSEQQRYCRRVEADVNMLLKDLQDAHRLGPDRYWIFHHKGMGRPLRLPRVIPASRFTSQTIFRHVARGFGAMVSSDRFERSASGWLDLFAGQEVARGAQLCLSQPVPVVEELSAFQMLRRNCRRAYAVQL